MAMTTREDGQSVEAAVSAQFASVAENYRTSSVHAQGDDLDPLVALARLQGHEYVLDAGCGAGHASAAAALHAAHVTAYDLTHAMLDQVNLLAAERQLTNIRCVQGNVESLPFATGAFDVVISRYSAHHWGDPQSAVHEFRSVLKAGGRLVISDIVAPESPLLDTWLQTLEVLRDPSHVRDHRASQWVSMFEAAGFRASVEFEWMLRLDFDSWVKRINTPAQYVAALNSLLSAAPREVWRGFSVSFSEGTSGLRSVGSFRIPGAIILGEL